MAEEADRASALFLARWEEQLVTPFLPRRARTLGTCGALAELLSLAHSHTRTDGDTRPAVDVESAGHGVKMIPEVAAEAARYLETDPVFMSQPRDGFLREFGEPLLKIAKAYTGTPPDASKNNELAALLAGARANYVRSAFAEVARVLDEQPKRHCSLVVLADQIISELRARGWAEDDLLAVLKTCVGAPRQRIQQLGEATERKLTVYQCTVLVDVPRGRVVLPQNIPELRFELDASEERNEVQRVNVICTVRGYGPKGAAEEAHGRVKALLGSAHVFLPHSGLRLASDVVKVVSSDETETAVQIRFNLPDEDRVASPARIGEIIASTWKTTTGGRASPLHDALRLRQMAVSAPDPASQLLLLWSGIERMTAGAEGYRKSAIAATKALVPPAVVLGKLRRDVSEVSVAMTHHLAGDAVKMQGLLELVGGYRDLRNEERVSRTKLLKRLLGPEDGLREIMKFFFEDSPLLVYRCHSLWRDFGAGDAGRRADAIVDYHERSIDRIKWQVGRIYRARNRFVHAGARVDQTQALVQCADFYLSQMLGVCVHYSAEVDAPPQTLLLSRLGQYAAFLSVLRSRDCTNLDTLAPFLERPTEVLLGRAR